MKTSTNNGGANDQNTGPNAGITTTRPSGRARGFDAITNSAGFYATNLPSDLYNIERLTFANGPQSILFGLGNAGGAFNNAESINLFADPNRYLPGGTATARQTALNPGAGRLYFESFPTGTEVRNVTQELRLTTSYEFDFQKHTRGPARHLGRHRPAALASLRVDEDRAQASRGMILGGGVLDWARGVPRQIVLNTVFSF